MTRVLIAAIIASAVVITVIVVAVVYRPRRTRNTSDRQLLDDAAVLFGQLATPKSIDDMDILRPDSVAAIKRWMARYNTTTKEIRTR